VCGVVLCVGVWCVVCVCVVCVLCVCVCVCVCGSEVLIRGDLGPLGAGEPLEKIKFLCDLLSHRSCVEITLPCTFNQKWRTDYCDAETYNIISLLEFQHRPVSFSNLDQNVI